MSDLERVARAIDPLAWSDHDRFAMPVQPGEEEIATDEMKATWERRAALVVADSLAKARAAVEALREPSEGVVGIGGNELIGHDSRFHGEDAAADRVFTAMIDAILREGSSARDMSLSASGSDLATPGRDS